MRPSEAIRVPLGAGLGLVSVLALTVMQCTPIAVVAVLVGTALLMPGTPGGRVLGVFVLTSSVASTWTLFVSSIDLDVPPVALLCAGGAAVGGATGHLRLRAAHPWGLSAAATAAVSLLLLWRLLPLDSGALLTQLLPGVDNASHLSILTGIRDSGGYLYWTSAPTADRVFSGLHDYPQGYHATAALLSTLVHPDRLSAAEAVSHYATALFMAHALLTLAASEVATALARRTGVRGWPLLLAAALPLLLIEVGPFSSLLALGFLTQLVAYASTGLIVLLALQSDSGPKARMPVVLVAAGLVTIAGSWYVALGLAAGPALLAVARCRRAGHVRWLAIVCGSVALLAAGAPHVLNSLASGAAQSVNAVGGVVPLERHLVVLMVLVTAVLYLPDRSLWRPASPWGTAWGAACASSAVLLVVQELTAGRTGYYFEKCLYGVMLLSLIGISARLARLPGVLVPHRRRPLRLSISGSLLVVLVASTVVHAGTPLARAVEPELAAKPWRTVLETYPARRSEPVLFWRFGSAYEDYLANRLVGAVYGQDSAARWSTVTAAIRGQRETMLQPVLGVERTVLLTTDPRLHERLAKQRVRTVVFDGRARPPGAGLQPPSVASASPSAAGPVNPTATAADAPRVRRTQTCRPPDRSTATSLERRCP